MNTQRWRLVISVQNSPESLHQLEVNADNWITALRLGREQLGEQGGLPPGATCDVAQQGKVTIFDPNEQRTYLLESLDSATAALAANAPSSKQPSAPPQAPTPRRETVAYSTPIAPSTRIPQHTVGYVAKPASLTPPRQPSRRPDKIVDRQHGWTLLTQRDADPTSDTPLLYRERSYVVDSGTDINTVEQLLKNAFEMLRAGLATKARGKYLNLAVFDHHWNERPERPPLVTLQWKDWLSEPALSLVAPSPSTSMPQTTPSSPAPEPSVKSRSKPPPSPFRSGSPTTSEHDLRLAGVFEDMQDLQLLKTPAEGLHFAAQILKKNIPCDAIGAYLYDINANKFRLVAAEGEQAERHTGEAITSDTGLFQLVSIHQEEPYAFDNVTQDPRYVVTSDGLLQPNPQTMLLMPLTYDHISLGALQLVNRNDAPTFDVHDKNILAYVAKQLAHFVHSARIRLMNAP